MYPMMGKRLSWFAALSVGAVVMLALFAAFSMPTSAQPDSGLSAQSNVSDFEVVLTISGTVQAVTPTTLTLQGGVVIQIPQGTVVPVGVVPGVVVTIQVTVNGDEFVAVTITLGAPTATPTSEP